MSLKNNHRPLDRQYIKYHTDGNGRDLYISSNSGGFCKTYSHGLDKKESYPGKIKYKYTNVKVHNAPCTYRSDGSGRDSYILRESGNLRAEVKSLSSFHLKDFLR